MYNKTIIRFGFCDIQNNQGLGKGYLDLDYSGYHKLFWISQKPHPIIVYCWTLYKILKTLKPLNLIVAKNKNRSLTNKSYKQLLDEVFVISRIIKVEVRVISRSRRLRLITLTETLIILDITKTESNNCFIIHCSASSLTASNTNRAKLT